VRGQDTHLAWHRRPFIFFCFLQKIMTSPYNLFSFTFDLCPFNYYFFKILNNL
jgi:hypothetical protein